METSAVAAAMAALSRVSRSCPATALETNRTARLKWKFMECARQICPGFRILPEQKPMIAAIFDWCVGREDGPLDPARGLWLHGDIGSGKTTMLRIIRLFCRYVRPGVVEGEPYSFRISNATEVAGCYTKAGYEGLETYIQSRAQAFDEIGSESRVAAHYGSVENVMQYILQRRYDRRYDSTTHVTTNFRVDEIARLYGPRIYDRCREMFNFVEFRGASFRAAMMRGI